MYSFGKPPDPRHLPRRGPRPRPGPPATDPYLRPSHEAFEPVELAPDIKAKLTPVDAGPKGRVSRVEGWEKWPMERRIAFLRRFVEDTARDPAIAKKATSILRHARVPMRDHRAQWAALLRWTQRNIYYVNEPNERLQSPQYTLTERHGDCDDMAILLGALGHSIRLPWRFVISGRSSGGHRVRWVEGSGPVPPNCNWAHIYLQVGGPPFRPEWWTFAEPTLDVPLGWDVITANGRLPEMGDAEPRNLPLDLVKGVAAAVGVAVGGYLFGEALRIGGK